MASKNLTHHVQYEISLSISLINRGLRHQLHCTGSEHSLEFKSYLSMKNNPPKSTNQEDLIWERNELFIQRIFMKILLFLSKDSKMHCKEYWGKYWVSFKIEKVSRCENIFRNALKKYWYFIILWGNYNKWELFWSKIIIYWVNWND